MQFNKPPVMEAWIEFRFALSKEAAEWDEATANDLIKRYFEGFNPESFSKYAKIKIDAKTGDPDFSVRQELFDRVRAFSDAKDYCVQARRDMLVFNQIKKDRWPGYDCLEKKAFEAVEKYMKFRGLDELVGASLHYRDIVSIPKPTKSGIHIEEWFRIFPEVPEDTFGKMSGFKFTVGLSEACRNASVVLGIESLRPIQDSDNEYRFLMDWHVTPTISIKDLQAAKEWLDASHRDLRDNFDKTFTEKTLDLFEPIRS